MNIPQKDNIIPKLFYSAIALYNSHQNNYISNDGIILDLTTMKHQETLILQYKHNPIYKDGPLNIINKQIITTVLINDHLWSVYYIASKYILISDGEWIAHYKLSLILPQYKHIGFNQSKMTIYDSILNMDKGKLVKVGNKWCDLCVNISPKQFYHVFGGFYCDQCFNQFIKWKNKMIYKYMIILYMLQVSDISNIIIDTMIQIYNLFY